MTTTATTTTTKRSQRIRLAIELTEERVERNDREATKFLSTAAEDLSRALVWASNAAAVLSGTLGGLVDFTAFPIPRTGFFVRGGLGAGAYWSQLRGTFANPTAIEGDPTGRQLAPGGAGMAAVGHELWLGRNVNLAMLLRYDGMLIFDGPRLVNGVSVGVALVVY